MSFYAGDKFCKYEIIKRIAEGSEGRIYLAKEFSTGETFIEDNRK